MSTRFWFLVRVSRGIDCSLRQRSRRRYRPGDQPGEMKLDRGDATRICTRVVDHGVDTESVAEQFESNRRRVQQLAKLPRDRRNPTRASREGCLANTPSVGIPKPSVSAQSITRQFGCDDPHSDGGSGCASTNRLMTAPSARCSVSLHVDFAIPASAASSVSEHRRGVS